MSTKEKVTTQVVTPVATVAQAEKPKIDLKFADYRKFNATSIKGTFDIALIKTDNNKEYVSIKNEKGEGKD